MSSFDLLEEDGRRALRLLSLEQLQGKTILITGASGIVGTHFLYCLKHCRLELGLDIEVVGVILRETPDHLKPLEALGHVRFLRGDMSDVRFLDSLPRADLIVHAATYGQPGMFTAHPEVTLKLNTTALFALIERLRADGRFLFISTSEVYSGLNDPPFREEQIGTSSPTHPRSCYIEAKRCGEAICHAYRSKGLAIKIARLSLSYGPGVRLGDKRVLNAFIERALETGLLRLMDEGRAKRTYCYIADAMGMMWRILLEGRHPVYNVGGTSRTTIRDIATLVGALLNVPVEVPSGMGAGEAGAPDDVRLDLRTFVEEFGDIVFVPFEHGVSRTIEWIKALRCESHQKALNT